MNKKQYNSFLQESIQNIKKALNGKNLTIFAGSGISSESNLPLWNELIDDIKKSLGTQEKDFLKIAELFHIQFKENRYYEKINQYFPKNTLPNILHKKILELNVHNLITTNWEDLFEKAIYELGLFYDVIRSDNEIGYSTGFTKFIKMHGSLDNNNIIFKESDYLNYSLTFPLIENYVKSIFSTDTVLFMGYSLSDINVKQIISWVNFQSKNIKPVYFLKVNAQFDYLEFEYYKSKNIFVLYWNNKNILEDECCSRKMQTLKIKGQMTYSFLEKISIVNINIAKLSYKEILEEFIDIFNILADYEYIMPQTIIDIVKRKFNLYGINEIFYDEDTIVIQNDRLVNFLHFLLRAKKKIIFNYIEKLMSISSIKCIRSFDKKGIEHFYQGKNKELNNYLYDFDFKGLEQELQQITFCTSINGNEKNYLKKAFLLYQNRNFRESYELLKEIAQASFKNRKLDIWFIAEFNKKQFLNLLRSESQYINDEEYQKQVECYCREIAQIDLQMYISKLPLKDQEVLKPLYDFVAFIDKKLLSSIFLVDSLDKDLNIWQNRGFSNNRNINNLTQIWQEIELFIHSYHLTLEYDSKISSIYENIFKSVLINKQISKRLDIITFVLSMGIRNFRQYQDIHAFMEKYFKTSSLILTDEQESLIFMINNLIEKLEKDRFYYGYFRNLIVFLSYIKLSKESFIHVVNSFNNLLIKNDLTITEYEIMNIFIVNQYNKNQENIKNAELENIIKKYIQCFIDGKFGAYTIEASRHTSIFENIFSILKKIDTKYVFEERGLIDKFLHTIEQYHINVQSSISELFLAGVWLISNKEIQKVIKHFLKTLLKNEQISDYDKLKIKYIIIKNNPKNKGYKILLNEITIYKNKYKDESSLQSIEILDLIHRIEKTLNQKE
jgi:hypothetical protein